jgi:hypothetical protein
LQAEQPLVVNYIMAIAAIPTGFDRVASITPASDRQSVRLTSHNGSSVQAPVDLDFLGLT